MKSGYLGACVFAIGVAGSADAQTTSPPPRGVSFLPHVALDFSWAVLGNDDPRFGFDAHVGADVDVFRAGPARFTFSADYEAMLGNERHTFDLNHGNYTLEIAASFQRKSSDYGIFLHHVSRHLSDRPNPGAISWHVVGLRAARVWTGTTSFTGSAEIGRVIQPIYVDYTWMASVHGEISRVVWPNAGPASLYGRVDGQMIPVNRAIAGRERLCGAAFESGVRFQGREAALEVFLGYERRIDAYPLDRQRARWWSLGFRFVRR